MFCFLLNPGLLYIFQMSSSLPFLIMWNEAPRNHHQKMPRSNPASSIQQPFDGSWILFSFFHIFYPIHSRVPKQFFGSLLFYFSQMNKHTISSMLPHTTILEITRICEIPEEPTRWYPTEPGALCNSWISDPFLLAHLPIALGCWIS